MTFLIVSEAGVEHLPLGTVLRAGGIMGERTIGQSRYHRGFEGMLQRVQGVSRV